MRETGISSKDFRELASEVGNLLTYEATRELKVEVVETTAWNGKKVNIQKIKGKKITIVPILRAGLGMLDGVLRLIPNAKISVVGLYRDEKTLLPVAYFDKVVKDAEKRTALIVDPMLATGGHSYCHYRFTQAKRLQTYYGAISSCGSRRFRGRSSCAPRC